MYLALYRKYRPRTFDEVISQKYTTNTLKNQVESGSVGHAYLFTGSRGTGKTSCAKILAMAVNCEDPRNGNPCLECDRCREILDGTATDIVEMDAASNNGVDDVRTLRDEVAYTPVSCKYRIYIIDEVHMLSTAAFNALLKTLEEPPSHVKFILATTELHKVPATISSRCQRFEFRRISDEESSERLLEVAGKENVRLEKSAAELISRLSDGGMRDALSILDRCVSAGGDITTQTVRDCAGVADNSHLFALSEMAAQHDTAGCIKLLNELHKGAKDISLIIGELSGQYRDMMLYKTAPKNKELLNVLPDEQDKLFAIADMYTLDEILRCLTLLQQCADGISRVKQRKTLAEMCFVKMCAGTDINTAVDRTETPKQVSPASPANSSKIEFREVEKDPAPVRKKSESEMSALERAQFARISTELQKTERMVNSAAEASAPAEKSEPQTAVPEPEPENTAPVEKSEPPAAAPESKPDNTAPVEKSEPPAAAPEPEPENTAPVEKSEPPAAAPEPEPENTAPVKKSEPPAAAPEPEPENTAPVEKSEPPAAAPEPEPDNTAPVDKSEPPAAAPEPEPDNTAPVEKSEPPAEYDHDLIPPPISQNDNPAQMYDYYIPDYGEPPPEFTVYNTPPSKLDPGLNMVYAKTTENGKTPETGSPGTTEKTKTPRPDTHKKEQSVVIDEESAANIAKLTQEQWEAAIPKTGAFYSKMLENSTIKAEGDILIISTSNKTILNNVKGKEVTNYEKEISKALGFHVHLKFVSAGSNDKKAESSPLQTFLDKCIENNIKVNIIE